MLSPEEVTERIGLRQDPLGFVALVGALLVAAIAGYDLAAPSGPRVALDLGGLALAGLLLAIVTGPDKDAEPSPLAEPVARSSRLRWAGLPLIVLGPIAGWRAVSALWASPADWKLALPWWLGGLLAALAGALAFDWGSGRFGRPRWGRQALAATVAALAVTGLALLLRVYRLGEVPPGIFIDETNSALDALAIVRGAPASPFATGWYETPTGYIYVQAGVISLLGPTLAALKLPGIVAGLLAALGAFFLGRLLFGTPAGLAAGLLMAFARWPVNMSRWGWNETAPPVAHVWAAYFLLRGIRSRRAADLAIGGLILGLGMYTYLSIRLALVAFAAYLAYRSIFEQGFLRRHLAGLALFGLLWGLTFAPLAVTYAKNPHTFLNRSTEVSIQRDVERAGGSLGPVAENVRRHLLMFNVEGDHNPRHNLPGKPMLDPVMGALLVVAAFNALALGLDHRRWLLLLWIPAILLGGVLTSLGEGPQAYRTLGVLPAVAILCGDLLVRIGRRLGGLLASVGSPRTVSVGLPAVAVAVALAFSGWTNVRAYFVEYASDPRTYVAFNPLETAVTAEVAAAPDPSAYYLSPRLYYFSPLQYFAAPSFRVESGRSPTPPYRRFTGPDDLPLSADGSRDAVVLWGPEWSGLADVLRGMYPRLSTDWALARTGEPLYERVTIPAADLREVRGLLARRRWADGRADQVRVADPAAGAPGDSSQVEWVGSLYVPASGARGVWAADGAPALVDGKSAATPARLSNGLHRLQVSQSGDRARQGLRLLWGDSRSAAQPVPAASLFAYQAADTHGLLGTYYQGDRWEGEPLFRRVDPVVLFGWAEPDPVAGPFSVSWRGEIETATSGAYAFLIESDDGARLWLDGKVAGESLKPDSSNFFEARVDLSAGRHPIRLDYFQRGGAKVISLRWIRPGQQPSLVPADVLWPAAR